MVTISFDKAIPGFKNEAGGHRIQRVPPTERRGRVHTSTVTCAVLDQDHQTTKYDQRSDTNFSYRWFSGTGKGGQHRNKHQCCLELTHVPTGLTQIATGRSRDANSREAMAALITKLDQLRIGSAAQATNATRAGQIGSGMRGDKRRTYRFQDDTVADHISGKSTSCKQFMRGDIERLW